MKGKKVLSLVILSFLFNIVTGTAALGAATSSYVYDEISSKEQLIKEIDLYIHVIDIKLNSSYFDTGTERDRLELERAKAFIIDLRAFKEKVLSSNESDIQPLIDEFNKTLKYRKIRIN